MKRALSALVVSAVVGLEVISACGGSDRSATEPTTQIGCIPEEIHISPASSNLHAGDSLHVLAIYTPCFGVPQTILLQWRSSDSSVATVAADGLVRARSAGVATIIGTVPRAPGVEGAMALAVQ